MRSPILTGLLLVAALLGVPGHSATIDQSSAVPAERAPATVFQLLPSPNARYADPDPAVQGNVNPNWKPGNPRHMRIARDAAQRVNATARDAVRYAYLLNLKGERRHALIELAIAKQRFPGNATVHWSEGWILLHQGDFAAALAAWQQAEALHGGQPHWVPYSKAVALMGLGETKAALAWWNVARNGLKPRLDSSKRALRYFSYWQPPERELLAALLQAHELDALHRSMQR